MAEIFLQCVSYYHRFTDRSKVRGGTELHIDMIHQLKEAVELLQDPSR